MKKRYQVFTRIWNVSPDIALKKGDVVEIVDRDEHEVCVSNTYFNGYSYWVRIDDFNIHCEPLN